MQLVTIKRSTPDDGGICGGVCCKNQLHKIMREEEEMPESLFLVCSCIVPMVSMVPRGVDRSQSGSSQHLEISLY